MKSEIGLIERVVNEEGGVAGLADDPRGTIVLVERVRHELHPGAVEP